MEAGGIAGGQAEHQEGESREGESGHLFIRKPVNPLRRWYMPKPSTELPFHEHFLLRKRPIAKT